MINAIAGSVIALTLAGACWAFVYWFEGPPR